MLAKITLAFLVFLTGAAGAQALYPPPPNHQGQPNWNKTDNIPRWCRHYSYTDYKRALWRCEADRGCRHAVKRQGRVCGLIER